MKRILILIVDDNEQFGKMLTTQLTNEGFAVDLASNTQKAEMLIEQNDYQVILLDTYIPDKDSGLGLLKKLRKQDKTKTTPLILMSAQSNELFKDEPQFAEYLIHASSFVSKLAGAEELVKAIKEVTTKP